MTVDPDGDRELLRKLIAQGGRKYTAGNIDRRKYERLVELGWLTATSRNLSDVVYEVTDKGRQDASERADVHRSRRAIADPACVLPLRGIAHDTAVQ
jgi:hypothetical protein